MAFNFLKCLKQRRAPRHHVAVGFFKIAGVPGVSNIARQAAVFKQFVHLAVRVAAKKIVQIRNVFFVHADNQVKLGVIGAGGKAGVMLRKRNIVIAQDLPRTPVYATADCVALGGGRINVKVCIAPRLMNEVLHNHLRHRRAADISVTDKKKFVHTDSIAKKQYNRNMLKRTGYADLPLHHGTVPKWLADRMMLLGTEIIQALLINYGKREVLRRLSDPLWFQSLGAVLGMDWHSSGITTSVMYALKRGINAHAKEFGLCVCGGRGKYSRKTPEQIDWLCNATGLDGTSLVRASKLCAKVDNTAVQDGFQLYQHNFILTDEGDWAVVQQGMNPLLRSARRYHWCSADIQSFVEEPHSAVTGENRGKILNLTDSTAAPTRNAILSLSHENPDRMIKEIAKISGNDLAIQGELFSDEAEGGGRLPLAATADGVFRYPLYGGHPRNAP